MLGRNLGRKHWMTFHSIGNFSICSFHNANAVRSNYSSLRLCRLIAGHVPLAWTCPCGCGGREGEWFVNLIKEHRTRTFLPSFDLFHDRHRLRLRRCRALHIRHALEFAKTPHPHHFQLLLIVHTTSPLLPFLGLSFF